MHESWRTNYNEIKGEIERFERMESGLQAFYFDVHTIEDIFDFYTDKYQLEKAERILQIGIEQHPNATSLHAKKAIILIEKGEDVAAISLMENLLKYEQSNPEVFLNLGLAYLRSERIDEAINCFKKSLQLAAEEYEDILLDVGIYLNQQEQFDQTIAFLEPGCKKFNKNENLLFELAYAYDKNFDPENGINTYNRLLDINPFAENAWYNMGILYIKNDDFENANICYDFALALHPSHGEALFNKANSLVSQGLLNEAIDFYIEYISYGYDELLPYHYIADCFDQLGMTDTTERYYKMIVEKDPSYIAGWFGYLAILINKEDSEKALEVSFDAINLYSEIGELWYLRARALLLADKLHEAQDALIKVFEDDPFNLRNVYELYQLKTALAGKNKNEKLLKSWLKKYPESPGVNYLATAYYLIDSRDLKKAMMYLQNALEEDCEGFEFFIELYPKIEKMILKSKKLNYLVNLFLNFSTEDE